jgi:hypothetical protein
MWLSPSAQFAVSMTAFRSLALLSTSNDLDFGAPPGIRTQNLRIKSPLLCR